MNKLKFSYGGKFMQKLKMHKMELLITFLLVVFLCLMGKSKVAFHGDEIFTFGLSNHTFTSSILPSIEEGKEYKGEDLFSDYTATVKNKKFDYDNVFKNQTADVHPPLYYILIHTVSSLFDNEGPFFIGLAVNILFAVIVFWQMICIFEKFIERKKAILFSTIFMLSMGFVNSVVFFRMYVVLTVWTNCLFLLFLNNDPEDKKTSKFYLELYGIVLAGFMTQYYFAILCAMLCLTYGTFMLSLKKIKEFILCAITVGLSVLSATLIFPAWTKHIFSGYRGVEAFENMANGDNIIGNIKTYFDIINNQIFGGYLIYVIVMILVLYIVGMKCLNENIQMVISRKYKLLLVPAILYIVIVAQISPYKTDRYIMNVMGIIYISVISIFIKICLKYSEKSIKILVALAVLMVLGTYEEGVPYLYNEQKEKIEQIEENKDIKHIYVWDNIDFQCLAHLWEFKRINSIQFVSQNNLELIAENIKNEETLVVYVLNSANAGEILNEIMKMNPKFMNSVKLYDLGTTTAYYLE